MSKLLDQTKNTLNNVFDYASITYDKLANQVGTTISEMMPIITKGTVNSSLKNNSQMPKSKIIYNTQQEELNEDYLNEYEQQSKSKYIGCYSDDPSNPSMDNYIGEVSNITECINLGKNNDYKYVGIQQGNKCFGSNNIPNTQKVDRKNNCNITCSHSHTGNCGGYYFNQVYSTEVINNIPKLNENEHNKKEALELLEKFINSNNDFEKINTGLNNNNLSSNTPLNTYELFIWLIIFLILIYLLIEYLYNKKK